MSGSGISWAICRSAPRSRQITTPAPHRSVFFTGRMPFLPPNQQRQSTEGLCIKVKIQKLRKNFKWSQSSGQCRKRVYSFTSSLLVWGVLSSCWDGCWYSPLAVTANPCYCTASIRVRSTYTSPIRPNTNTLFCPNRIRIEYLVQA